MQNSNKQVLVLGQEIEAGTNGTVFKAVDPSGHEVAVKMINGSVKQAEREYLIGARLHHPNIGRCIGCTEKVLFSAAGQKKLTSQLILEYYGGGNLFELVKVEPFSEDVVRVLATQMVSGVRHMHSLGLIHFDLKLNNFMADGALELQNAAAFIKVIDFGWTESVEHSKDGIFTWKERGALEYWAPEIQNKLPHRGDKADVFALGKCLFELVVGFSPFKLATLKDVYYRNLIKDSSAYWAFFDPNNFLSEDFKHLMTEMLHEDPTIRFTLDGVQNHPWFLGLRATSEELREELLRRRKPADNN